MTDSDSLLSMFTAKLDQGTIQIPEDEIRFGNLEPGGVYRVAIHEGPDTQDQPPTPVEHGEQLDVEIEDLGDQGDGITRVERGYVVIVPDTKPGERVRVEVTDVKPNVAFAEVIERYDQPTMSEEQ